MAKIVFTFFEVNLEDADVASFIKKLEVVLKSYAGEAYHFRYRLEEPSAALINDQKDKSKGARPGRLVDKH